MRARVESQHMTQTRQPAHIARGNKIPAPSIQTPMTSSATQQLCFNVDTGRVCVTKTPLANTSAAAPSTAGGLTTTSSASLPPSILAGSTLGNRNAASTTLGNITNGTIARPSSSSSTNTRTVLEDEQTFTILPYYGDQSPPFVDTNTAFVTTSTNAVPASTRSQIASSRILPPVVRTCNRGCLGGCGGRCGGW